MMQEVVTTKRQIWPGWSLPQTVDKTGYDLWGHHSKQWIGPESSSLLIKQWIWLKRSSQSSSGFDLGDHHSQAADMTWEVITTKQQIYDLREHHSQVVDMILEVITVKHKLWPERSSQSSIKYDLRGHHSQTLDTMWMVFTDISRHYLIDFNSQQWTWPERSSQSVVEKDLSPQSRCGRVNSGYYSQTKDRTRKWQVNLSQPDSKPGLMDHCTQESEMELTGIDLKSNTV